MTTTSFPLAAGPQAAVRHSGGWMTKRGVLLLFLQMPVVSLVVGYALELVSFPVATFAVFVSSAAFPAWVSYRTSVSEDLDEPIHHLHRHAFHALLVVATFTIVLVPTFLAVGVSFWQLWHDLGAELTAEPPAGSWSLVAGMIAYGLAAAGLAISYYVLVRRPRLLHAALVLVGTLSALLVHMLSGS
jgi:hypothetical protein